MTEEVCCHLRILFASPLVHRVENATRIEALPSLDVKREHDCVLEALMETKRAIRFSFKPATVENLATTLHHGSPVLHFCGHGLDGALLLEDETMCGLARPFTAVELSHLLEGTEHENLKCVVVSACHSQKVGQVFLDAGVPNVVCVEEDKKIEDSRAIKFESHFYTSLFRGHSVASSFRYAQRTMNAISSTSHAQFILLSSSSIDMDFSTPMTLPIPLELDPSSPAPNKRPSTDGDSRVAKRTQIQVRSPMLDDVSNPPSPTSSVSAASANNSFYVPEGQLEETTQFAPTNVPSVLITSITARRIQIFEVFHMLSGSRVVSIRGAPGVGKFTVAGAVAHFARIRGMFQDGIVQASLRGCATDSSVFGAIVAAMEQVMRVSSTPSPCRRNAQQELTFSTEIIAKIGSCSMLLILTQCEDAHSRAHQSVLSAVRQLISHVQKLRVIIVSRVSFGSIDIHGCGEAFYDLSPLDSNSACELFLHLVRSRLHIAGDADIDSLTPAHPVLQFLAGHPQAISLCVNLLRDRSFAQMTELLSQRGCFALQDEALNANDITSRHSLAVSLQLSVDMLKARSESALGLFAVMGALPAGVFEPSTSYLSQLVAQPKTGSTSLPSTASSSMSSSFSLNMGSGSRLSFLPGATSNGSATSTSFFNGFNSLGNHVDDSGPFNLDKLFSFIQTLGDETPSSSSSSLTRFHKQFPDSWKTAMRELTRHALVFDTPSTTHNLFTLYQTLPFVTDFANKLLEQDDMRHILSLFIPSFAGYISSLCAWLYDRLHLTQHAKHAQNVLQLQEPNIWEFLRQVERSHVIASVRQREAALPQFLKDLTSVTKLFPQILSKKSFRIDDAILACGTGAHILEMWDNEVEKSKAYVELGRLYTRRNKLNEALAAYKLAEIVFTNRGLKLDIATVMSQQGAVHAMSGNDKRAEELYAEALKLFQEEGDIKGVAIQMVRIASIAWKANNLERALVLYRDVEHYALEHDDKRTMADALRDIGKIYIRLSQFEDAQNSLEKSLEFREQLKDIPNKAFTILKLGDVAVKRRDFSIARGHFMGALRLFEGINHLPGIANCWFSLGDLEIFSCDFEKAKDFLNDATKCYCKLQDPIAQGNVMISLGRCYLALLQYEKALACATSAIETLKENPPGLASSKNMKATVMCAIVEVRRKAAGQNDPRDPRDLMVASQLCREARDIASAVKSSSGVAYAHLGLGVVHQLRDEQQAAQNAFRDAQNMFEMQRDWYGLEAVQTRLKLFESVESMFINVED
eukprot:c9275_g1_i1.p1 GENE.c9275_g1_i1~~c9275_g1_i1.p1  ORF type:complete len:1281 (-),score=214.78 c9275_g1_i1:630-4415(-)